MWEDALAFGLLRQYRNYVLNSEVPATGTADRRQKESYYVVSCSESKRAVLRAGLPARPQDEDLEARRATHQKKSGMFERGAV